MPLNHSLVGVAGEPTERSWTSADALLYAIGVGAGLGDPLQELQFTTENTAGVQQQVLPTYGVLLAQARPSGNLGDFDRAMLVHAEQSIELHKPLPVEGTLRTSATVTGIYDKGSGALVETENRAVDAATGEPLVTTTSSTFIRGEGDFGGDRGTAPAWQLPDRAPDQKVTVQTRPEQALLYRLCGDRNPLHADPAFAARGLQSADPARPVHVRVYRAGAPARGLRLRPGALRVHVRPVQQAGAAGRVARGVHLGGRERDGPVPDRQGGWHRRHRPGHAALPVARRVPLRPREPAIWDADDRGRELRS